MWAATIEKVIKEGNVVVVPITYTDGTVKVQEDNRIQGGTLDGFKAQIQAKLNSLNSVDVLASTIISGPFDPKPVQPTPEQLARSAYSSDIRLFGQMTRAITAGAKKEADQDFIDLKARLGANFIDSYIDLF